MFDEREAFVAAIAANPDEDTPRLAFADWLQEHGEDDRAEFIRLQCEAARSELSRTWSRPNMHPTRVVWDRRAHELFEAGWPRWFAPFFAALGVGSAWPDRFKLFWAMSRTSEQAVLGTRSDEESRDAEPLHVSRFFVARGFGSWLLVDGPHMPLGALAEGLRHEPLTDIAFHLYASNAWGRVAGPALQRLRKLGLRVPTRAVGVADFVAPVFDDPYLTEVRDLNLGPATGVLAPAILTRLLASPLADRLRRIKCALATDGLAALATAPPELPWEALSFRLPALLRVPPHGSELLSTLPFRGNVRELSVAKSLIGDEGVGFLAATDGWNRLERLDLTDTRLTDDGFRALAAAPFVRQLTHLRLDMNQVTDEGVRPLVAALDADRVKEFAVAPYRLSAELVAALRDQFGSRFVEH